MDPLLTEFDEQCWFGRHLRKIPFLRSLIPSRTNLRGTGMAKACFLIALTTSILSVLCNAGIFRLILLSDDPKQQPLQLSFGYLYELNAAFLYIFLAPVFVFVGIRFVRTAQLALQGLAARGSLVTNTEYRAPRFSRPFARPQKFLRRAGSAIGLRLARKRRVTRDPLEVVGNINRKLFPAAFLLVITVASAVIIVGTEFNPRGGDYWNLAFGYVQAMSIPYYKDAPLSSLGRKVNPLPGVDASASDWKQHWRIASIEKGGASTRSEKFIYWIFITFALGLQILFVPFVIWIFFKSVFVLRLVYKATCPNSRSRLAIILDFEDENEAFGLSDLHRAYNYLVAIIFVGAVAMASVVLANVAKGSHRIVGSDKTGPALGSMGQAITSFLPLVVFFVLGLFLFFLRLKTEEARDRMVIDLDLEIRKSKKRKRELEAKRKLVCAQSAWPDSNFKTWYGTTLPSYVIPYVFLTKRPEWAGQIYDTWIALADLFDKIIHPLSTALNWLFGR